MLRRKGPRLLSYVMIMAICHVLCDLSIHVYGYLFCYICILTFIIRHVVLYVYLSITFIRYFILCVSLYSSICFFCHVAEGAAPALVRDDDGLLVCRNNTSTTISVTTDIIILILLLISLLSSPLLSLVLLSLSFVILSSSGPPRGCTRRCVCVYIYIEREMYTYIQLVNTCV